MTIKETKSRYCKYCKVRHPIDDFTKDQVVCKWGRAQEQKENAQKNIAAPHAGEYEKHCKVCGRTRNAKQYFKKDLSRPDGFYLYCRDCDQEQRRKQRGVCVADDTRILVGLTHQFRTAILKTVLKTIKDTDRSITRQLVEDFRHDGEPISLTGREWQIQILNDMRPHIVGRKPSQTGYTWLLERQIMALLIRYSNTPYRYKDHTGKIRSRFIEAIYSFETADKASKWSKVRLKKIKDDNPHIRDALKAGETDSALLMKLGRTALHLVGRATISGVLTISADIVVIDEKDRDQDPSVASQIGSRTLESEFMNTQTTKGLTRETSTPEVSGAGISLQYESSNQTEWEIRCVQCKTWQTLNYPDCIGNFYDIGQQPEIDKKSGKELIPFWRCMHCHAPIDWKTIGKWDAKDPDYYENCRWVVRKPEKYNEKTGKGIVGYQVPFAGPQRNAAFFMAERDEPEHDIAYLHNHMLGLAYDDITKVLVADNFHTYPEFNWGYAAKEKYILGCDTHPAQGGYIVICRQVKESVSPAKPDGKWVVVYCEHVRNNRNLWDDTETIKNIETIKKGRLYELIVEYNVALAVIDLEPDTNEVEKLIDEFAFSRKVWANKSSGTLQDTFTWVETEIEGNEEKVVCRMTENKVAAIDYYFNKIRFGDILFLEKDKYPGRYLWREYRDAHTNLYKSQMSGKLLATEKLASQNIREIYKKRIKNISDHWVMATKFCVQGIRILTKISNVGKHVAPPVVRGMSRIAGT